MFDFAWSEIALIAVVAMIAIGPKDMPVAMRAVTGWIKKARRMAAEFQTHVDEMMREADLSEVRNSINDIRQFDFRTEVEKAIDPDGSIRDTFSGNPLEPATTAAGAATSVEEIAVAEQAAAEPVIMGSEPAAEADPAVAAKPCRPAAPSFVPPNLVQPASAADAGEAEAPAFVPPQFAQQRRPHLSA
jgi:sec-independent protein translocase protein TatB